MDLAQIEETRSELAELSSQGEMDVVTFVQYTGMDKETLLFASDPKDPLLQDQYRKMFESFLSLKGWSIERLAEESVMKIEELNGAKRPEGRDERSFRDLKDKEHLDKWGFLQSRKSSDQESLYATAAEICAVAMGYDLASPVNETRSFMTIADAYFESIPLSVGQAIFARLEQTGKERKELAYDLGVSRQLVDNFINDIGSISEERINLIGKFVGTDLGNDGDLLTTWRKKEIAEIFECVKSGNERYQGEMGWAHLLRDLRGAHGMSRPDFTGVTQSLLQRCEEGHFPREESSFESIRDDLALISYEQSVQFRMVYENSKFIHIGRDPKEVKRDVEKIFRRLDKKPAIYAGEKGWGGLLRDLREAHGMSQGQFMHLDRNTVERAENGIFPHDEGIVGQILAGMPELSVEQRERAENVYKAAKALKEENEKKTPEQINKEVDKIFDKIAIGKKRYQGVMAWGNLVRDLREAHGFSQENFPGVSRSMLGRCELGAKPRDEEVVGDIEKGLYALSDEQRGVFRDTYDRSIAARKQKDPDKIKRDIKKCFKKVMVSHNRYNGQNGWGNLLRDLREAHGIKTRDFPGVVQSNLSGYESGRVIPGQKVVENLISGLDQLTSTEKEVFRAVYDRSKAIKEGKDVAEAQEKIDQLKNEIPESKSPGMKGKEILGAKARVVVVGDSVSVTQ